MLLEDRWQALTLKDLEEFLADAGEEGLLWEVKGDGVEALHPRTITKACCGFANSERGGYLILGVPGDGPPWRVTGVARPRKDATVWLSSIIRDGLQPPPRFEPKVFDVADVTRFAAVVRIWPAAEPPVLTASGVAYERVSGQTVPIADPRRLSELFQRGVVRRSAAEIQAARALDYARKIARRWKDDSGRFVYSVSVKTLGMAEDISARLFQEEYAEALAHLLKSEHAPLHPLPTGGHEFRDVTQSTLTVRLGSSGGRYVTDATWLLGQWDGVMTAGYNSPDASPVGWLAASEDRLLKPWMAGTDALARLGGSGPTFVLIGVGEPPVKVSRWMGDIADDPAPFIPGVIRELRRSTGEPAYEPPAVDSA